MRNRKNILIGCLLFALFLGAIFLKFRLRDPIYEGRRLSEWVVSMGFNGGGFVQHGSVMPPEPYIGNEPSDPKAIDAISKVGTNAFPLLVSMLGSKEWVFERRLQGMANKHPIIRKFLRPYNLVFARQVGAVSAFYLLGSKAEPILPDIIPMLRDPEQAMAAMYAVMYINPGKVEGVLSLTNVFSIQKDTAATSASWLHSTAILILGKFGRKAVGAVPIITGCLTSTNAMIRATAAVALARIGSPSERAIALMIANLPKTIIPNPDPRKNLDRFHDQVQTAQAARLTLWALGRCGDRARGALPILSNFQQYPNVLQREARVSAARIMGEAKSEPEFDYKPFWVK